MSTGMREKWMRRLSVWAVVGAGLLVVPVRPASAQPAEVEVPAAAAGTSLEFVPADVAFYRTSLHMKETLDAFLASEAYARLKAMPAVQQGLEEFRKQWDNPDPEMARFKETLERDQVQRLLKFLGDAISHEVFVIGDMKHADLVELGQQINVAVRQAQLQPTPGGEPDPAAIARAVIDGLDAGRDKIVVPSSVIGFKIGDKERAQFHLGQLDGLIKAAALANPALQGRYAEQTIGETEYMVLELDGTMVPWQLAGFFLPNLDFQKFNRVVAKLNELEMHVALGIRDDYLLLSIASSTKPLEELGTGAPLYNRQEFAPLTKHANGRPLMSVQYTSEAYAKRTSNPAEAIAAVQQAVEQALSSPQVEIQKNLKQRILADARELEKWAENLEVEAGATSSFEFRTDRGYETFAYDWAGNEFLDTSRPLTILKHTGGNPVGFAVARTKYDREDYDTLAHVLQKLYGYAEQYLMHELNEEERQDFQRFNEIAKPLFKRADTVTREKLLPALKDGQSGIVFDMQAKSTKWHRDMPEAAQPLPLPEIAVVYGVSDAELLKEACAEYDAIAEEFVEKMREFSPEETRGLKIPDPEVSEIDGATLYVYPLPEDSGLDEQIAPSAAVAEEFAAGGITTGIVKRTLKASPVGAGGLIEQHAEKNLGAASHFDFAAFMDGLAPWVDYGITRYFASQAIGTQPAENFVLQDAPAMAEVREQAHTVIEVLKCFRGASSVTYRDGDAVVTHSEAVFEDLKK